MHALAMIAGLWIIRIALRLRRLTAAARPDGAW
jgi:hypothetical protein